MQLNLFDVILVFVKEVRCEAEVYQVDILSIGLTDEDVLKLDIVVGKVELMQASNSGYLLKQEEYNKLSATIIELSHKLDRSNKIERKRTILHLPVDERI